VRGTVSSHSYGYMQARQNDRTVLEPPGAIAAGIPVCLWTRTLAQRSPAAMTKPIPPHSDTASKAHRQTSARTEQAAFQAAVKPHLQELFEAARRELRYRVALGDFGPDLLTAEELVGETLARAWRDRCRRPQLLNFRVWLLAVLFRVAENIPRDEAQFRKLATESLQAPVPPEPVYDDDESFWEWYQPDELTRWEDVVADPSSLSPEDAVAADEQFTRSLAPRARQVFVLHTIHRVSLRDVARALGISGSEAKRLLAEARRLVGVAGGGERS
jgi:RNA polymerase sigma factor (sigma-70 family)